MSLLVLNQSINQFSSKLIIALKLSQSNILAVTEDCTIFRCFAYNLNMFYLQWLECMSKKLEFSILLVPVSEIQFEGSLAGAIDTIPSSLSIEFMERKSGNAAVAFIRTDTTLSTFLPSFVLGTLWGNKGTWCLSCSHHRISIPKEKFLLFN